MAKRTLRSARIAGDLAVALGLRVKPGVPDARQMVEALGKAPSGDRRMFVHEAGHCMVAFGVGCVVERVHRVGYLDRFGELLLDTEHSQPSTWAALALLMAGHAAEGAAGFCLRDTGEPATVAAILRFEETFEDRANADVTKALDLAQSVYRSRGAALLALEKTRKRLLRWFKGDERRLGVLWVQAAQIHQEGDIEGPDLFCARFMRPREKALLPRGRPFTVAEALLGLLGP